ncbi:MAG: hypothetical protein QOD42_1420 [Sphingomonadales bacterium]|nr:hypothetical protein [Sphingomonadales bacterium]
MRLLLDTHVLIWMPTGDPRMSGAARAAIEDPEAELFISAITAFELTDLQARRRVTMSESVGVVAATLGATLVDFPAEAWAIVAALPGLHRDPVGRMTIAHAIAGDFTLVTADKNIRAYPVKSRW